jgi:ABC-2 type transport system ATP-binding protein
VSPPATAGLPSPAGPPSPAEAALSLRGLGRRFGDLSAVQGLTFDVHRGELFALVGPDGAGKTTTLRMLAGVLRPSEGDARVAGVSVARAPEAVKPHVAYMSQRFGLYEDLTVAENLDFYADLYRVPRGERAARYEELYRFSRLGEFSGRLAGALSGGMKQKLSLSCALVHRPRVLLLDEPTFGVDPISRRELWLILHARVAEGVTVLVSTSYLDEAERCDRVALLHGGRVLALDRPEALQRALAGRLVEVRAQDARRARDVLRGGEGVAGATLFGSRLHVLLEEGASWAEVEARLVDAGVDAAPARAVEPSLEDVFIRLVAKAEGGGGARA